MAKLVPRIRVRQALVWSRHHLAVLAVGAVAFSWLMSVIPPPAGSAEWAAWAQGAGTLAAVWVAVWAGGAGERAEIARRSRAEADFLRTLVAGVELALHHAPGLKEAIDA